MMNRINRILFSWLSVGLLAEAAVAADIEPTWESLEINYDV